MRNHWEPRKLRHMAVSFSLLEKEGLQRRSSMSWRRWKEKGERRAKSAETPG